MTRWTDWHFPPPHHPCTSPPLLLLIPSLTLDWHSFFTSLFSYHFLGFLSSHHSSAAPSSFSMRSVLLSDYRPFINLKCLEFLWKNWSKGLLFSLRKQQKNEKSSYYYSNTQTSEGKVIRWWQQKRKKVHEDDEERCSWWRSHMMSTRLLMMEQQKVGRKNMLRGIEVTRILWIFFSSWHLWGGSSFNPSSLFSLVYSSYSWHDLLWYYMSDQDWQEEEEEEAYEADDDEASKDWVKDGKRRRSKWEVSTEWWKGDLCYRPLSHDQEPSEWSGRWTTTTR